MEPKKNKVTIKDTKKFWEENPFYVYEAIGEEGSTEFFKQLEEIKETDTETFSKHLWGFDQYKDKRVLDIGCGPGWYTYNYAKNGARIVGMDLTKKAVNIAKKYLRHGNLKGSIVVADAQRLPFRPQSFDHIASSGVLHHAPDIHKAIAEVHRVLKPGGSAIISIYYKNLLLNPYVFYLTRLVVRLTLKAPSRRGIRYASSPEEFVRMYDGDANPVGWVFTREKCLRLFNSFEIKNMEPHCFVLRFFPFRRLIPRFVHKLLDNYFGTMWYVQLEKR